MAVPGQTGAAVTTAQTASPTAGATSTTAGNQQMGQAQYQRQFQQYQHIQAPMGQQLILPQMNAFHMQQFPLLQGTFDFVEWKINRAFISATMMPTQMVNELV